MSPRDRSVTAALIAALVIVAGVLAIPAGSLPLVTQPSAAPSATAAPANVYREGVVGVPTSITPVTARTRSERTLVGLVFSGLVKLGAGSALEPDLAASWTQDKTGTVWTVQIREDALWQDGQPVTADDVVFTVNALKDPAASGAVAATWAEVTATALGTKTVQFTLATPIVGFLAALTQPLLPSHLLNSIPMADLATTDFARHPVGTGPYVLTLIDGVHAVLTPVVQPGSVGPSPSPSGLASLSPTPSASAAASAGVTASGSASPALATLTPVPVVTPAPGATPIDSIEIDFFATESDLADAFRTGQIDAAAGLTGATTDTLLAGSGVSAVRYPTTTLSAVVLNLRADRPELRNAAVRRALLAGIDRASLVQSVLGGNASVADTLVPPDSWAFDPAAAGTVPFDRTAASKALATAGWTKVGGSWALPKAKQAFAVEILTVPADANPSLAALGAAIGEAWRALGFKVTVTPLAGTDLSARLRSGDFTAAVLDISMGLEPDLYPLLASTQVRTSGSNISGYQDPGLDTLLEAARAPGLTAARTKAWSALLTGLAQRLPILPIAWNEDVLVERGLSGATPRLIASPGDRFWDVLAWRLAASR